MPCIAFCVVWPSHTLTVGLVTTKVLCSAANAARSQCLVTVTLRKASIHHRAGLAAHKLWNTMHRRQACIWFDNLRHYRSGADPHSRDLTLNCTAVAALHTAVLPAYPGLPELVEIQARVPKVAADILRSHIALIDHIDVANKHTYGEDLAWTHASHIVHCLSRKNAIRHVKHRIKQSDKLMRPNLHHLQAQKYSAIGPPPPAEFLNNAHGRDNDTNKPGQSQ